MKKIYLTLFLLPAFASAQVTITQAVHGINPGNSSTLIEADTGSYTPGSAGASQTWNFSGLVISGTPYTTNYVAPSTTPYASSFPGATVASDDGTGDYTYYTQTSSGVEVDGEAASAYTLVYSNTETLMKYPFAFGNGNTDNYAGTATGVSETGTVNISADAYGTLILPSGSYSTLRVKTVESYTQVVGTASITTHVTLYSWYSATSRFPLLQYVIATASGAFTDYEKQIIVNSTVVGIDEPGKNDNFLSVYPNPSHGNCTLNYDLQQSAAVSITVMDMTGQKVISISKGTQSAGSQTESIDLSGLAKGIYMVQLNYGDRIACKRVSVE